MCDENGFVIQISDLIFEFAPYFWRFIISVNAGTLNSADSSGAAEETAGGAADEKDCRELLPAEPLFAGLITAGLPSVKPSIELFVKPFAV